jgi:cell division protein FtsB
MPKLDFEITRDLQAAGASQELAEAVVRAISEKTVAQLVTKNDLAETREALQAKIGGLGAEIAALRASMATMATKDELAETREILRAEIADLRNEMRTEISGLRASMATMATKDELAETREALRHEMTALELRLTEKMAAMHTKVIIWLVGTAIASVTLMATNGQLLK